MKILTLTRFEINTEDSWLAKSCLIRIMIRPVLVELTGCKAERL